MCKLLSGYGQRGRARGGQKEKEGVEKMKGRGEERREIRRKEETDIESKGQESVRQLHRQGQIEK